VTNRNDLPDDIMAAVMADCEVIVATATGLPELISVRGALRRMAVESQDDDRARVLQFLLAPYLTSDPDACQRERDRRLRLVGASLFMGMAVLEGMIARVAPDEEGQTPL
jgi:hypothetical protein